MSGQDIFMSIILPIILSFLASLIFWFCTFKLSFTKVIFAGKLISSDEIKQGGYRFKMANIGWRDLIELNVVAKLTIKDEDRTRSFFLNISESRDSGFITVLPGMRTYRRKKRSNTRTMTVFSSESMQERLAKEMSSEMFQLKDVFDQYGERIKIVVYVYGNDRTTSARRMFESKEYSINDLMDDAEYKFEKVEFNFFETAKSRCKKISQIKKCVSEKEGKNGRNEGSTDQGIEDAV